MKNRQIKIAIILFSIVMIGLSTSSCGSISFTKAETTQTTAIPTVVPDTSVINEGKLVPKDNKYLSFPTGGKVAEILVKKGDQVSAGQVLARLADREPGEANLASANLELQNAQQAYDELVRTADLAKASEWQNLVNAREAVIKAGRAWDNIDTDSFQSRIDDASIEVQNRKDTLDDAQKDFDKYKDLPEDNTSRKSSKDKLDQAQKDYDEAVRKRDELVDQRDLAQADLAQAQANQKESQRRYDATLNGPDPEKLDLAQKRLDNAKAQQAAAQKMLDNLELKAPFAGEIVDINVVPNQLVSPDTWVILLADFSEWFVETHDLTEIKVVKIDINQDVTLTADALPDVEMKGNVVEISKVSEEVGGDVTYKVRIKVDQVDQRLRWGMTVQVTFLP